MIRHVGDIRNAVTSAGASDKQLALKVGTIVKAEVVNTESDGNVLLRIMTSETGKKAQQVILLKAFTEVPLSKGQHVYLEVIGSKNNIRMQFIGNMKDPSAPQQSVPAKFLDMLAQISGPRLGTAELRDVLALLRTFPESLKTAIPEFRGLEKLMLNVKEMDGKILRAFVETSGVAFETRIRVAVMSDPHSALRHLASLQTEGDLKGLLLKISSLLNDRQTVLALGQAGLKVSEVSSLVQKFIQHIEFYQLTSRINDMFCTFMPVLWDEMKDGEFQFRKNKRGRRDCYTCDINLDLESLGRLSASVSAMENAFYVSLFAERPEIAELMASQKRILEERFSAQGLLLQALTIQQKTGMTIGKPRQHSINVRI